MSDNRVLASLWRPELVASPLSAREPLGVIRELAQLLADNSAVDPDAGLLEALEAREAQAPTFIGRGVALPHARLPKVHQAALAVGASADGITWGENGEKAYLVFLVAVPRDHVREYLDLVSRITKVARVSGWAASMARHDNPGALATALMRAFAG